MTQGSLNRGNFKYAKEITSKVVENIKNGTITKKQKNQKIVPMAHQHESNIIPELSAIRKRVSEALVVFIDQAKQRMLLDDDSLILANLEKKLVEISNAIMFFLEGKKH